MGCVGGYYSGHKEPSILNVEKRLFDHLWIASSAHWLVDPQGHNRMGCDDFSPELCGLLVHLCAVMRLRLVAVV